MTSKAEILIVDDDDAMRGLIKARLADLYETIDTGNPGLALGLVLEKKPDVVLLDLMMVGCSGFEICQSLHSLSYTSRIPVFVITGESAAKYKNYVFGLGAADFFEKPLDFARLRSRLAEVLKSSLPERRAHPRVRMKLILKLKGVGSASPGCSSKTSQRIVRPSSRGGVPVLSRQVRSPSARRDSPSSTLAGSPLRPAG